MGEPGDFEPQFFVRCTNRAERRALVCRALADRAGHLFPGQKVVATAHGTAIRSRRPVVQIQRDVSYPRAEARGGQRHAQIHLSDFNCTRMRCRDCCCFCADLAWPGRIDWRHPCVRPTKRYRVAKNPLLQKIRNRRPGMKWVCLAPRWRRLGRDTTPVRRQAARCCALNKRQRPSPAIRGMHRSLHRM